MIANEEMPVSNYRPEYGTYLGYPAIVGRKFSNDWILHLTEEEKEKLPISARNHQKKIHEKDWTCIKAKRGQKSIIVRILIYLSHLHS